jgi:hypothetical protein
MAAARKCVRDDNDAMQQSDPAPQKIRQAIGRSTRGCASQVLSGKGDAAQSINEVETPDR